MIPPEQQSKPLQEEPKPPIKKKTTSGDAVGMLIVIVVLFVIIVGIYGVIVYISDFVTNNVVPNIIAILTIIGQNPVYVGGAAVLSILLGILSLNQNKKKK